jgi:N,N'-diacetyllegionaminate synthase
MNVLQPRRTRIIAEACANHLGDPKIQEDMIWAAADAKADYIKFQSWQVKTNARGQAAAMKDFELSDDDHHRLMEVARQAGIGFSTTVFDVARVEFVASLNLDFVKVASPDCASFRLLSELIAAGVPKVIVSTGMSDDDEVLATAQTVLDSGSELALLHCMYPLVDGAYHLRRMETLRLYAPETGLSDHSAGDDLRASRLAIALGADWIERHFILDRTMPGKDAAVSVNPDELRQLADAANDPNQFGYLAEVYPELMGEAHPALSDKVRELRTFYQGRWGDNR